MKAVFEKNTHTICCSLPQMLVLLCFNDARDSKLTTQVCTIRA
jgi:hypothetical protein